MRYNNAELQTNHRVCRWSSIPQDTKGTIGSYEASWALDDLAIVLLLHVSESALRALKRSDMLQFVLHVKHVHPPRCEELWSWWSIWFSRCEERWVYRETLCSSGNCWAGCRANGPTSARHGNSLGYIRIWATPSRRLVFWDGAPNPSQTVLRMWLSG